VNALDIAILVCAAIAAWAGWRMGFLARIFSWVGLGAGLYLAVRFMPNILDLLNLSGRLEAPSSAVRDATIVLAVVVLVSAILILAKQIGDEAPKINAALEGAVRNTAPLGALRTTIEHATIIIAGLQRGRARLGG